jgi:hemerythrin-like metal-binding protein
MVVIKWSEAMSVGVPAVDHDHKILIGLINSLGEATRGDDDKTQVIAGALATLIAYTQYHFEREEKMMEACGYPDLPTHREEHHALTQEVLALKDRFLDSVSGLTVEELLTFLTGWLNHHILLQDMEYREHVEGNAAAEAAAQAYGEFDFAAIGAARV